MRPASGLPCGERRSASVEAAAVGEVGGGQVVHEAAGLGEVALGDRLGGTDMGAGLVRVGVPDPVRRLEQHLLAGQALGERVVDLHGEPLAFGERALAALGGGEFAAGADQVVDQCALAGGLALHMDEDGGGEGGDGGRREQQVRVEAARELELRGDDEHGQDRHEEGAAARGSVRRPV